MRKALFLHFLLGILLAPTPALPAAERSGKPTGLEKIQHIVVIVLENHSFDNLYGQFPGADGISTAAPERTRQNDHNGQPYPQLPLVLDTRHKPPEPDSRFPDNLPSRPFAIDAFVPPDQKTGDLMHRFYQHAQQINGGHMDRFAAESDAGGLVMGYYEGRQSALWDYAARYTLADRFFQAAFGGSFLNHVWLVCACTPRYPDAPAALRAELDASGRLLKDGAITPDGYAVNSLQPRARPYLPSASEPEKRLPPQTLPTIGDRLSDRGVSWAWYSGGWNDALRGEADSSFQFHHQAFVYFQRYGEDSRDRKEHLKDEQDLVEDLRRNRLPAVAFVKPLGRDNQHPSYTDLASGDRHTAELLARIEKSAAWPGTVVIVTYDEYGGFWDHVPPPKVDRWGPGSRVPALVIGPFAKRGYVDHTVYDSTSILKLIENRHGLAPLSERDAKAGDLRHALMLR